MASLPNVTLTYRHHIHSLETNNEYIDNDNGSYSSITSPYADNYSTSSPQGCFTTPEYHIVYSTTGTERRRFDSEETVNHATWSGTCQRCSHCGYQQAVYMPFTHYHDVTVTNNYNYWTTDETDHPGSRTETRYVSSCGYMAGAVTDVIMHYEK